MAGDELALAMQNADNERDKDPEKGKADPKKGKEEQKRGAAQEEQSDFSADSDKHLDR